MIRALIVLALLVSGCETLAPRGGPYPEACASLGFSEQRCRAIVASAAEGAGAKPEEVVGARFVPGDRRATLGGPRVAVVELTLATGEQRVQEVWCATVPNRDNRACSDDPQISVGGGVDRDVPCAGEPPDGCATEPPTPRPASVAAARPLEIAALDVPLDHLGSYRLAVGEAELPDGYLTERRLTLADPRPTTFWIEGGVHLDVRPVDPDRPPIGSRFRDPFDGVELVDVFLVFEVVETSPGATLQVRDIVVR